MSVTTGDAASAPSSAPAEAPVGPEEPESTPPREPATPQATEPESVRGPAAEPSTPADRPHTRSVPRWAWLHSIPGAVVLLLVSGAAAAFYVRYANPAVGGGNSGEFQVMAPLLGIVHPPSYPLYLLLAHGAALLPLPGDVAWRINVLTACLGALSISLLGGVALAVGRGKWLRQTKSERLLAAALAMAALTAAPRLWSLAVEAEVFTLHLALVIGFWLALALWQRTRGQAADALLLAASLLAGLGISNHRTYLFVAAGGALVVVLTRPRTLLRNGLVGACVVAVVLGLSPYLYVLRGLFEPVPYFSPSDVHRLTWGETWYVLQGNASGETGGGRIVLDLFADRAALIARSWWLWQHVSAQFGVLGPGLTVVGALGLLYLLASSPVWTTTTLLGAAGAAIFAMAYGKYPDADRYLLPLEALAALGIGIGFAAIARGLGVLLRRTRKAGARPLGALLGAALGGYFAFSIGTLASATTFTRGGYQYFTISNLDAVEPNAVVCSWWASSWGWWFAQYEDGHRPDVLVVPKGPDECVRDVVPEFFGKRPVYLPALTDRVKSAPFVFFPSRDLWLAVSTRAPLVEGMLLKGPDDKIWLYTGGQRRWVTSMDVFTKRELSWDRVQLTADYVLKDIPEGAPLFE